MKKITLKSVEEYYHYNAQGNAFAPKFKALSDSAKSYWTNEFKKYKQER